jgi:hypothetical protein
MILLPIILNSGKWVPVTKAWRVLRLRMEERPSLWRVATCILNRQSGQPTRSSPAAWRFDEVLTTPDRKNFTKASGLGFSFGLKRGVLWSELLPKYNSDDKMKKKIGRACRTNEGEEVRTGFWWGNLRVSGHLEDLGVDGSVILKCIFKKSDWAWTGLM